MVFKRIEYDPHAAYRMRIRGFTQPDVRWVLENGTKDRTWTPAGGEQRWLSVSHLEGLRRQREVGVIYLENDVRIYVITVEWTD